MTFETVTVACGPSTPSINGKVKVFRNHRNLLSPAQCYQRILDRTQVDILVLVHSDLDIHLPNWAELVMGQFQNDQCVLVGLGGALGLGTRDLYRKRYAIHNLARQGYISNASDWIVHGSQLTSPTRVAVVDQFFVALRVQWLRDIGGFPLDHLTHHLIDGWLACEATRRRKETWVVPVQFTHRGGSASTGESYSKARWLQGGDRDSDHRIPHEWLFRSYRDILPIEGNL